MMMNHCPKCHVEVKGDASCCPLCQGWLEGTPGEAIYPKIKTVYQQYRRMFRWVLMGVIIAGVGSVGINWLIPSSGHWSLFVVLGLACFAYCVFSVMRRLNNIPRVITNQAFFVCLISVVWDLVIGWQGWSIDYVIPITCIVAMATVAVVAQARHIPASDYVFCMTTDAVFGVVPMIFLLLGAIDSPIPSVICICASIFSLSAILIFEGGNIRQEIIKRFHV